MSKLPPEVVQALDALDRELFEMIQTEHLRQVRNQRRALLKGAFAVGLALVVCVLALGVISWGWLLTIGAVYVASVANLVALLMSDKRISGRASKRDEDR